MVTNRGGSLMRLRGLVRKEFLQVVRDPSALAIAFVLPVILLLLFVVVMTLIGALLTALLMAREWERGTMEALMVTPVSMLEVLVGKILPYFILGMGGLAISVVMGVWLFEVPLRGSIWVLLLGSSLFLLTALGMGLFISTVTRVQFVAAQVAIITTFLPAFILSGFIFDIGSMPRPLLPAQCNQELPRPNRVTRK